MLLREIQDLLDASQKIPEDFTTEKHIHSVAEILLRFLDSLPAPLIPESALQYLTPTSSADLLLPQLPPEGANLCKYLFCFIKNSLLAPNSKLVPGGLAAAFAKVLLQGSGKELDKLSSILEAAVK